jgi:hypothetical protein
MGTRDTRVTFPPRRLATARYRITVEVVAPVNPGPAGRVTGRPFTISRNLR